MNIVYRVFQKTDSDEYNGSFCIRDDRIILDQNIINCASREHFKDIMRSIYGEDIKFANSKSLKPGDLFIIIIAEDAWDGEEWLNVQEYKCAQCGKSFKTNKYNRFRLTPPNLEYLSKLCGPLFKEQEAELSGAVFDCVECYTEYYNNKVKEYNDYLQNTLNEEYIPDIYLDREHLYSTWDKGYIYIITKKSTGEFYVGQTNIVPIFRWGQHLKTARFPIENLVDYKFEVLEEVSDKHLLLNREAYWINKMHDQNPELCLNKNLPKFEQK